MAETKKDVVMTSEKFKEIINTISLFRDISGVEGAPREIAKWLLSQFETAPTENKGKQKFTKKETEKLLWLRYAIDKEISNLKAGTLTDGLLMFDTGINVAKATRARKAQEALGKNFEGVFEATVILWEFSRKIWEPLNERESVRATRAIMEAIASNSGRSAEEVEEGAYLQNIYNNIDKAIL